MRASFADPQGGLDQALGEAFSRDDVLRRVGVAVAYASQEGVQQLARWSEPFLDRVSAPQGKQAKPLTIVVGLHDGGTTSDALEELLSLAERHKGKADCRVR